MTDTSFHDVFPGREVTVESLTFKVFPLGVNHLPRFSDKIIGVISAVSQAEVPEGMKPEDAQKAYLKAAAPYVLKDLTDILWECTTFEGAPLSGRDDLSALPHYVLPLLCEAWLIESFGDEGKVTTWIEAIQNLTKSLENPSNPFTLALSQLS